MNKTNSKNIEKYHQLCERGASLKLLSVYCTLRHPYKRAVAIPYIDRKVVDQTVANCIFLENEKAITHQKYSPIPLNTLDRSKTKSPSNKEIFPPEHILPNFSQTNAVLSDSHLLPESDFSFLEQGSCIYNDNTEKSTELEKTKASEVSLLYLERAPKASRKKIPKDDSISNFTNNRVFSSRQKELGENETTKTCSKASTCLEASGTPSPQTNSFSLNQSDGSNASRPEVSFPPTAIHNDLSLPCPGLQPSQVSSPFPKNQFLDKVRDSSLHSFGTPSKNPRLAATCVSFLNRSPFRGKNLPLAQSPTIQLGNKVFHVPGSLFLGKTSTPQKKTRKPKPRRPCQPKHVAKVNPEPILELSISDTSDPYAFIPQRFKPTMPSNPIVSTQTLEDILLQAKNTSPDNILDDSGDECCTDSSSNVNLTPKPLGKFEFGFINSSPYRDFPSLLDCPAADRNKKHFSDVKCKESDTNQDLLEETEDLGDLSVKMTDLSFSNIPLSLTSHKSYNGKLVSTKSTLSKSTVNLGFQPSNSEDLGTQNHSIDSPARNLFEKSVFTPAKLFSSKSNLFAESTPDEPDFDVQAFLDNDLGMFAGLKKL